MAHALPAPFRREHQLNDDLLTTSSSSIDAEQHLPGHPRISLANIQLLTSFLENELYSEDLEKLAPYFWMMSLHSSANISALHRQIVKGREIVITEDPSLHLVWLPNRIHLKPFPAYLLSFTFWDQYLLRSSSPLPGKNRIRILKTALGFIRTYYYLASHESDFILAQEKHLIPQHVSWIQFCAFTSKFASVSDADVSSRYAFGELRLSRLNFYCKFILGKVRIHRLPTTYGTYFSRFYTPILFVFAVISVILNAMQVELGVEPLAPKEWPRFWTLCRLVAVVILTFSFALTLFLLILFTFRFVSEWQHAIRDEVRRRKGKDTSRIKKATETA
ncbi:hypothetical protein DL95DRAFT_501135 [Leptodontidium sp. 2 PMI_412]|nr:hypothetical protein DL95DRAFT_501135 [Leptodontidium sp. 2 PMI_412]